MVDRSDDEAETLQSCVVAVVEMKHHAATGLVHQQESLSLRRCVIDSSLLAQDYSPSEPLPAVCGVTLVRIRAPHQARFRDSAEHAEHCGRGKRR